MDNNRLLSAIFLLSVITFSLAGFQNVMVVHANTNTKVIVVPDDYSTIQSAINNAGEGDTVYVKKGTYIENPVVNKSISLIGENRDVTVIDVTAGLKVERDNVTITGLTIYDGWQGITLFSNYSKISGNKITDTQYGIVLLSSQNNTITENLLQSIGLSAAIQLSYSNNNLLKNNVIESCTEGIQLRAGSSHNVVLENVITDCQDVAIRLLAEYSPPRYYNPNGNTIMRNNISNSRCGTSVYGSSSNVISKNNYVNNTIQFSANEDYYLTWGGSRSINDITQNYWSDYNGTDANKDGVGDIPYVIDANNRDTSPLISPINIPIDLPTSSPTPFTSPSPTVNELSWLTILPLLLSVFSVAVVVRHREKTIGDFRNKTDN
jgi:nitrous oxidase accessory protein